MAQYTIFTIVRLLSMAFGFWVVIKIMPYVSSIFTYLMINYPSHVQGLGFAFIILLLLSPFIIPLALDIKDEEKERLERFKNAERMKE